MQITDKYNHLPLEATHITHYKGPLVLVNLLLDRELSVKDNHTSLPSPFYFCFDTVGGTRMMRGQSLLTCISMRDAAKPP